MTWFNGRVQWQSAITSRDGGSARPRPTPGTIVAVRGLITPTQLAYALLPWSFTPSELGLGSGLGLGLGLGLGFQSSEALSSEVEP